MKKLFNNEDGQVMVLFALVIVVLMGFAALAVDVGSMTLTRSKLQSAADAAALAGAQDLPNESIAEGIAVKYAKKNGVQESDVTAKAGINYDPNDPNKIEVVCKKKVSHTFARVIGFKETEISARAVAKKNSQWAGDALPFINLLFDYSTTDPIAWTNAGDGIKGTLTDFYTRNSGSDDPYFELDYTDGLTVTPGYANGAKGLDDTKLSDGLAKVLTPADMGIKKVYLFSLRADIIKKGTFTVTRGNQTKTISLNKLTSELKNGDVINPDQLVLIECRFDDCKWANQHDIELTYLNKVYDLGNNDPDNPLPDFPTDYISPAGGSSALVE